MAFRQQKKRPRPLFLIHLQVGRSQTLLDLCTLTDAVTQVVQLRSADLAAADCLHGDDGGRVYGEDLLAAYAVGDAADGDSLIDAAVLLGDDGAFESLIALAAAFLYADGDTHGIADVQFGQFGLHVLFAENFDPTHTLSLPLLEAVIPEASLWARQRPS